jgi:hypothetical protein
MSGLSLCRTGTFSRLTPCVCIEMIGCLYSGLMFEGLLRTRILKIWKSIAWSDQGRFPSLVGIMRKTQPGCSQRGWVVGEAFFEMKEMTLFD